LKRKKAESDFTDKLVEEFLKRGYLDDKKFAIWWLDRQIRKQKSNRSIEFELRGKGIDREVIVEVMTSESESEVERLKTTIQKLHSRTRYQDQQKLTAYLIGKGFSYSLVKEVLNEG
jgi:SOS response regulatory protein OraA/RecX